MIFNGSSTNPGLYQQTLRDVKASTNDLSIYDFTQLANSALDSYYMLVRGVLRDENPDDYNLGTIPEYKDALVADQADYALPSDITRIKSVEIKTSSGAWYSISKLTSDEYTGAFEELMDESGSPQYWYREGNTVYLKPAPNYSQAASLLVRGERVLDYFASNDTSKEPGINKAHHRYISLHASVEYAASNSLENYSTLANERQLFEQRIIKDARNSVSRRFRIKPSKIRAK